MTPSQGPWLARQISLDFGLGQPQTGRAQISRKFWIFLVLNLTKQKFVGTINQLVADPQVTNPLLLTMFFTVAYPPPNQYWDFSEQKWKNFHFHAISMRLAIFHHFYGP